MELVGLKAIKKQQEILEIAQLLATPSKTTGSAGETRPADAVVLALDLQSPIHPVGKRQFACLKC